MTKSQANFKNDEFKPIDYKKPDTLPLSFLLVQMLLETDKVIHGWYIAGTRWYGYRYQGEGVKAWKRKAGMY